METKMKIGSFIPIRLDSERLPEKALKIINGRPVVYHLLDRVAASQNLKSLRDIVVCTTHDPLDDQLATAVADYGASIFRGDKLDLIKRFKDAADTFGFDIILQIDGDDPLADTEYMDLTINALLKDKTLDAAVTKDLPFGVNVKSFTRAALEKVYNHYQSKNNDTGFGLYFIKSKICKCLEIFPSKKEHRLEKARLTLDYQEDLEVFEEIFSALYKPDKVFGLEEIIKFLKSNPHIIEINKGLQESYLSRSREILNIEYRNDNGYTERIEL